MMQPLKELSFICLLVKQGLCLIELVEGLPVEKEKKLSPGQEEEVLIAKSQPLQSQDLAINLEPTIPQNYNTPGVWLPQLHLHFINMSIIHPFMSSYCMKHALETL